MIQFEKMFNFMKKPWVMAVYTVLIILIYHFVDKPLAIYFHELDLRTSLWVFKLLTTLGKVKIYLVLFGAAGLYFRYISKNSVYEARAWFLLACIIIPNLVCLILKVVLSRARPDLLFSADVFGFYWFKLSSEYWSLPSGHTTTVIALAAGLSVLFPKYFYAFIILAFFVILSRVLLYFHYLSDVMTAFYLCILVIGALFKYIKNNNYLRKASLSLR